MEQAKKALRRKVPRLVEFHQEVEIPWILFLTTGSRPEKIQSLDFELPAGRKDEPFDFIESHVSSIPSQLGGNILDISSEEEMLQVILIPSACWIEL